MRFEPTTSCLVHRIFNQLSHADIIVWWKLIDQLIPTSGWEKITFNMIFFLKRIKQMWQLLIKPTFIFYNFSYTLAGPSSNLYHASWILKHCATEIIMINERILKYSKSLTYMNFTDMTFTTRISLALNRFQMNIA